MENYKRMKKKKKERGSLGYHNSRTYKLINFVHIT